MKIKVNENRIILDEYKFIEEMSSIVSEFITEKVVGMPYTEMLICEINHFNEMIQRYSESLGYNQYPYVYIERHNPDIWTDWYSVGCGMVYDRTK